MGLQQVSETDDGQLFEGKGTQRQLLLHVLQLAAQYGCWMTLEELANKTRFPPASISAQLRHLRKAEFGGWKVEKRPRDWEQTFRRTKRERVWEYRLKV